MNQQELLVQIKQAVREVEPDAEVILYGSRSRGDAVLESEWDLLILVNGPLSDERTDRIRHRLYEGEWKSEEVFSSIVRNREEWNSGICQAMPFHQRVQQEGTRLLLYRMTRADETLEDARILANKRADNRSLMHRDQPK
jgi:hypothetical protein